ncbi:MULTISPECIES: neutral/alkaline non-lysosomal ceramidase N-terminal domain-containing protein [unclassified Schlesneria]|uniref:neutral/alkaline non-lysosomal ceramidase N-terminal domain-containing protein n=1 Tax=Schlesneria TaxID=656899 RepID=UPI0035A0DDE7
MNRVGRVQVWCTAILCLGLLGSSPSQAADTSATFLAGAYAQDISPQKFPISLNGGMSDQQAKGVHDPLHARCIVLNSKNPASDDRTSLAIVVCDSCMIPRDLMDRAKVLASKKTGIPTSNILISATHAHSCPTVTGVFQSEPDADYVEFLVEKIAKGIEQAQSQLEPARIGWGAIDEPSQLFNRRWLLKEGETVVNPFNGTSDRALMNPGLGNPKVTASIGLIDPQLSILSIQSRSGRPIALLANYSLHYVGGVEGGLASADYYGEFAQRIKRHLNASTVEPAFVGIMSNGTSGDVNNVDFSQKSIPARAPYEQIQFVAELLAQDAVRVCNQIQYQDYVPLACREKELELGVRKPSEQDIDQAKMKLDSIKTRPLGDMPSIYARETVLLSEYPATVKVKVQAIRIGSLGIATSPCETFTETGLAIKKESPFNQTFTIELANGYNGYLPPPGQFLLGGYETWRARSSYLAEDSEPKIRATALELLSELNK